MDRKYLNAKKLFHVKLREILDRRGLNSADLERLIPGVGRRTASRWFSESELQQRVPDGVYTLWLLEALDIEPVDLLGEHSLRGSARNQNARDALTSAVERIAAAVERQAGLQPAPGEAEEEEVEPARKTPSPEDARELAELADEAYAQIKRRRRKKAQP